MHDPVLVAVLKSLHKLLEILFEFRFTQQVEECVYVFTQVHMLGLGDYVEVLLVDVHVNELNHVWVVQLV